MRNNKVIALITSVFILSAFIAGCGSTGISNEPKVTNYNLAPLVDMPVEVQNAPVTVKQAYQFAVANPEILSQLPCYCGCGGMGHTSNYSCYLAGEDENGDLIFDGHALGCSLCVDITQDAMRLLDEGKSTSEIRAYVDQTYSRFGPSNMQ